MDQFHFGDTIKKIREDQHISQYSVAKKLGISQPGYSKIEKSRHLPENHTISTIAKHLGVTVKEITPAWWNPEVRTIEKKTARVYILNKAGHGLYTLLLLGLNYEICSEMIESPRKIPMRIAATICIGLIYYFTVDRTA